MTDTPSPLDTLRDWIGRSERRSDTLTAAPLAGLSTALRRADDPEPQPGMPLPPLAHWLYFLPRAPQREIGVDGHPSRGGFVPPVPLPRRMWAGGRLAFARDLRIGDTAERHLTIQTVEPKAGRSGALVFVTVRHEIRDAQGVALSEEHDVVYRDNPRTRACSSRSPRATSRSKPRI